MAIAEDKPEFVVDTSKRGEYEAREMAYDSYNDPYLIRYFSKAGTIKQMMQTGMVRDVS